MKLLESGKLEALSSALCIVNGASAVQGRVESYSCKMARPDKVLYKRWRARDARYHALGSGSSSAFCDTVSRKTLFYLIATLNAAFPDYDFSLAKSSEFSWERQGVKGVVEVLRAGVGASGGARWTALVGAGGALWQVPMQRSDMLRINLAIDSEVALRECRVYSYTPDPASDPSGEPGTLHQHYYFFYNKRLKRIVFLTCRTLNVVAAADSGVELDEPYS